MGSDAEITCIWRIGGQIGGQMKTNRDWENPVPIRDLWWRRGRVELPVQRASGPDLLRE